MIRFLINGLMRDRSRSLFPILTVTVGVMMTVFFHTYMQGAGVNITQSTANFSTGHVKVMSKAYAERADLSPNELAYAGAAGLLERLRREYPDFTWTPRIRFNGLLDIPDANHETKAQAPVTGFGVDLLSEESPERGLLNLPSSLVRGRMPVKANEVLVSDELARQLKIEPGATATLIGATMYGSMATANFLVVGTVRFGVKPMDRGAILVDIADIQRALDMEDAAGEILGFFPDNLYHAQRAAAVASEFNTKVGNSAGEFSPVMVTMRDQPGVTELVDYVSSVSWVVVVVFTAVMSIVLWNAGLIASLRRYGEIGLRLAYGEDKGRLYRAMIAESLVIGLVGSVAGTALAMLPAYWLQTKGFDVGYMLENSSMMLNNVIRARITPASFVIGFVPGLLATGIGTAVSGIGIFRRQTATLMKELEA